MTPFAFRYRQRTGGKSSQSAYIGDTIQLEEQVEYVLSFPTSVNEVDRHRLETLGADLVQPDLGILSFRNFVGKASLAGVEIEVVSTKLGLDGTSRLLQEISEVSSSLIFGWRAPLAFAGSADTSYRSPVPYHQLQFLRHLMILESPGARLQDWLSIIERNATRRFEPDRPVVPLNRVRRLDHRAMRSVFTRLERLVPVSDTVILASNRLAEKLSFGTPAKRHFPATVAAPRGRLSFDTPENRFAKHVVSECLALVYRFVDHPKLHDELRRDCRAMLGILEGFAGLPFIAEAGQLTSFQSPSQALAKAEGYRDVRVFWGDFTEHVSLPAGNALVRRLLEGRDVATLYEYWVFVKIVQSIVEIAGLKTAEPPQVQRDEMGESLSLGLSTAIGTKVTVYYNRTYRRSNGTAYSTPLRPDVIVQIGEALHAFDAKYRLVRLENAESDPDDGGITYKRGDLYKMHAYRDAITGLRSASVVYPGSEFVFFERNGHKRDNASAVTNADGVGAVPLRPTSADPTHHLRSMLTNLLKMHEANAIA
ncbi:putative component of viral defense system (DUF524 family) [Nitrobacter vulgaris]|uniref:DUF2357 domain-containing protein n=1 Tax=Nitrobacter vulgaris TaxID=29421 RepID=UPI00285B4A01|nr:DUF2357 domain-containing protein [Nitrobacter vulgaris]MDR6302568.1 putative component of viral defense system (DUF524 family) [Nitrobacter vulgaris]